MPSIVKSSIALGSFPADTNGIAAWLPAEAVSGTIVDVALLAGAPPFAVNVVHPRPVPWDYVMLHLAGVVGMPMTPFADWVKTIEERGTSATAEDLENIVSTTVRLRPRT